MAPYPSASYQSALPNQASAQLKAKQGDNVARGGSGDGGGDGDGDGDVAGGGGGPWLNGNQLLDNVYFTVAKLITKKGVWVPGAICHRSHGRILVNTAIARTESRLPLFLMYTLQYPPEINQK